MDSLGSMVCEMVQFLMNFFSSYIVFILTFSLCCSRFHVVAMLPDSKDRNMLQVFLTEKEHVQQAPFVMCKSNCEDFEH